MSAETDQAIASVEAYLAAMEARNLDLALTYVSSDELALTFPGARKFTRIEQILANSGGRYARIGKRITGRSGWVEGDKTRVMITGTLYGAWPDGTEFEDIRFVDIFALKDGRIVRQEVWNDAGERLLALQKEKDAA